MNLYSKVLQEEIMALRRLQRFTPLYHGVIKLDNGHSYMCLEDLTQGFVKPNVMDVKLGTQTFEPDAPPDKRLRELAKYPQQAEFGVRIVGMRVYADNTPPQYYHPVPDEAVSTKTVPPYFRDENGYRTFDKQFGRSLSTRDLLLRAFRIFFKGELQEGPPGRTSTKISFPR